MASEVESATKEIMGILRGLPTPRYAAAVVACVRANLHLQAGGDTESKVRKMIADDDAAALEIWQSITGNALGH